MKHTKQMVFMAVLTSLSVVLGIIDAQIASFLALVPGAKIGLANITIMLAIIYFDFKSSLTMAFIKTVLIGLLLGAVSTFLIGFSGTMLSFFGMYVLQRWLSKIIGVVGISVIGAVLHAIGQVVAVMWFYNTVAAVVFIPQLMLISVATGIVTGMLTTSIIRYVDKTRVFEL